MFALQAAHGEPELSRGYQPGGRREKEIEKVEDVGEEGGRSAKGEGG